jgi:hypothetical protein
MRGFITTKDMLLHPAAIVDAFGMLVYVRCVVRILSGRAVTFLACI